MGYHTGTDFETFPSEKASDVVVSAVCEGTVIFAGWVKGYGGVLIQSCLLSGNPVTVLYGHMNASSLLTKGTALYAGQHIGSLGKGFSSETDGERKHLHLGVHRGSLIDFRGYVSASSALSQWINAYPLR